MALVSTVVLGVGSAAPPVGASPVLAIDRQAAATGDRPLSLVEQDPWVGPRGELRIVVETVTTAEARLDVRVFDAVDDPDLVTRPPEFPDARQLRRLDPLVVGAGRQRSTVRLAVVPEADGTFGDPLVLDAGVYPVLLTLTRPDGSVLGRLTTQLVRLPAAPQRHPLALVVPIHADPDRTSEGRALVDPGVRTALDRRLDLLLSHRSVPVTLQLTPETVNALASDRSGAGTATLERIAAVVRSGGEVVATPFVRLDVDSWYQGDGIGLLGSELDLGRATLDAAGFGTVGDTVAVGDRLDDDLVRWLAGRGLRRVVVPADALEGDRWPTAPRPTVDPAVAVVAVTDVGPAEGDDPVLAAYRTAAAAVVGVVGDRVPDGQGWALAVPVDPRDDDTFLRTLLEAVDSVGPFTPATVSRFDPSPATPSGSGSGSGSGSAVVQWTPKTVEDLGELPETLRVAATRLASVGTMVGEQPLLVRARGLIYVAASRDLSDQQRGTLVEGLDAVVPLLVGTVTLPRDDGIVVTSHRATLPVVIRYEGPTSIRVTITITSSELEIEGENPRILELSPGPNDLEIPIRSRRSGEFELEITAAAPDGEIVLQSARLTVRSRAISGVGVFLSVGALTYLLVWWVRNHRKRRSVTGLSPAMAPAATSAEAEPERDGSSTTDASRSPSLATASAAEPPGRGPDRPVP